MAKKAKEPATSEPPRATVLFVDDDEDALVLHTRLFRLDAVRVLTAHSGLHALEVLKKETAAVVVTDYWMPGMHGILLLDTVQKLYPKTRRVLLTSDPDAEIVLDAKGHKVLTKGMDPGLIRRVILREVKRYVG
jgi:DNA-binding NtrC family response regulator